MKIIFYFWILPVLIGLVIFYFGKFKGQTIKDFVDEISYYDSILPPYWLFITFPIVNILFINVSPILIGIRLRLVVQSPSLCKIAPLLGHILGLSDLSS